MDELLKVIRLKNITSSAMNTYRRLEKCHLPIDDIMLFPVGKAEAVELLISLSLLANSGLSSGLRVDPLS